MKGGIINNRKSGVEVWLASALFGKNAVFQPEVCGQGIENSINVSGGYALISS